MNHIWYIPKKMQYRRQWIRLLSAIEQQQKSMPQPWQYRDGQEPCWSSKYKFDYVFDDEVELSLLKSSIVVRKDMLGVTIVAFQPRDGRLCDTCLTRWTSQPIKIQELWITSTYVVTFLGVFGKFVYKTRERKKYIEIDITISIKDCQLQEKMVACKEYN